MPSNRFRGAWRLKTAATSGFRPSPTTVSENGRVWMEREDAIRAFSRWLGFRRTGSVIDDTARKLIKRLLRGGQLESSGNEIRRI